MKIFVLISKLPMMIQVSRKSAHFGSKKLSLSKKTTNISKDERFLQLNFDLNQIALTQNLYPWNLTTTDLIYIFTD